MLNLNWNKDQTGQTKQNQTLPWLIKALEEPGEMKMEPIVPCILYFKNQ